MKKSCVLLWLTLLFYLPAGAQNTKYAESVIDTLCSRSMHGRGYVNNGDHLAAEFIKNEFIKDSLKSFGSDYIQVFKHSVETLPGKLIVKIGKNKMSPAIDYLVSASSPTIKGKFKIEKIDSQLVSDEVAFKKLFISDFSGKFILLERNGIKDKKLLDIFNAIEYENILNAKGIIKVEDKLIWEIDDALAPSTLTIISINKNSLPVKAKKIFVNIEQKIQPAYDFFNVIGYIKGITKPDSFVVFTAHYDHLGQMGAETYFPGANDNASGTAMMLDLAKYYSKNKPVYSVVFIATTGEELGLKGSEYYVNHSLFPLSNIRFLINLDIVGTGEDGIKVVNGTVFENEYKILTEINNEKNYLPSINKRGEAAISDHYPFYKKGVKSFYIYTLGGISEYHNIYDKAETLPLTKYSELFNLLVDFVKKLN